MIKKNKKLKYASIALALIAMGGSGCALHRTSEILTPVPNDIRPESLFWDPKRIQAENCPDISGAYLVREEQLFASRPAIPLGISPKSRRDVTLNIKQTNGGISFIGESKEQFGEHHEKIDGETLGCSNGSVIRRWTPRLINGAESGRCLGVTYGESHWRLDNKGNLEARDIVRTRCWKTRGEENRSKDKVLPVEVYERIY